MAWVSLGAIAASRHLRVHAAHIHGAAFVPHRVCRLYNRSTPERDVGEQVVLTETPRLTIDSRPTRRQRGYHDESCTGGSRPNRGVLTRL